MSVFETFALVRLHEMLELAFTFNFSQICSLIQDHPYMGKFIHRVTDISQPNISQNYYDDTV